MHVQTTPDELRTTVRDLGGLGSLDWDREIDAVETVSFLALLDAAYAAACSSCGAAARKACAKDCGLEQTTVLRAVSA